MAHDLEAAVGRGQHGGERVGPGEQAGQVVVRRGAEDGGEDIVPGALGAKLDAIGARLTRWAKGLPLRGTARSVTSPVNLAVTASAGAVDPRGWATNGNEVLP